MSKENQSLHSMSAIPLHDLVKEEYRTYQIYTLMDRAIPYLQDGLKPSQRRILFTLWKNQNKGLVKVSSLTGLVLTLHPHGPASVEQSIVNLAQDYAFSNNYPLIDKKGYFGERMETQAAAARYIEAKLGKVADLLLFDDMNQVQMVPNYDEKVMEPVGLLPKLPIMLLNGAEGIGTGFSSVIPSFNHSDIIKSMISFVETGKVKKVKPYFRYYSGVVEVDEKGRIITRMEFKKIGDQIFITEVPKGYDSTKIYRHLNKFMDSDFIKDYIDSSVDNTINIELVFKRGQKPSLEEVEKTMGVSASIVPNYTLITEKGVKVFHTAEEIIEVFTIQRLAVTKRRYELLIEEYQERLDKNNEIIRFIKEKHYAIAEKKANRKDYVDYLNKKKFVYSEYLADMAIYRMTKEEVEKRQLLIKEDTKALNEFKKILKSPKLIKDKLIEELNEVNKKLSSIMDEKEKEKKKAQTKQTKPSRRKQ
ncbi:MAG: DNA gyrase subunit A [Bacteriovoracaceae bacterium]